MYIKTILACDNCGKILEFDGSVDYKLFPGWFQARISYAPEIGDFQYGKEEIFCRYECLEQHIRNKYFDPGSTLDGE